MDPCVCSAQNFKRRHWCIQEDDFTKNLRKTLCMQLWDHAVHLYNNREYRASANFYIAAMHSTDQSSATWAALDKECRRINRAMPEVFRSAQTFLQSADLPAPVTPDQPCSSCQCNV